MDETPSAQRNDGEQSGAADGERPGAEQAQSPTQPQSPIQPQPQAQPQWQAGWPQFEQPTHYSQPGYPQPGQTHPGHPAPGYQAPGYYAPSGYYQPGYQSGYQPGFQSAGTGGAGGGGAGGGYAPSYYDQLGGGWGAAPTWAPPVATAPARRNRVSLVFGVLALLAAIGVASVVSATAAIHIVGSGTSVSPDSAGNGSTSGGSGSGSGGFGSGSGGTGSGSGGTGSGGTGSGSGTGSSGTATATQQIGVVDVNTVLQYQNEQAAGTGLVLTSNGEILTNNHVIDGATSVTVTVVSTGKTYKATVVGDDPTADVAVLQLSGASGLKTAKISTSAKVSVGDAVTAVGNAGGVGGTPSTASGTVVALDQAITASDDSGQNPENLTGLIESNAPIQAGDSGGPLYNSNGQIIGIDTAGSGTSGRFGTSTATQAYSIPITTAVSVAAKIEAGDASSTIHLGYPAFLGVQIAESNAGSGFGTNQNVGALISGIVEGSPAVGAGLTAGDTITGVGSTAVTSANGLQTALATHHAGETVKISWVDASGRSHSASVRLIAGPAD